ncbi:oxysterol-binding protein-related protein 1D-like isoform X3 [Zingiber officinale]|uniref:oxysterol-binding protein-related protein 1D-like isoform X3 n=1 Tax=Zingiber officinale TaxID=94328 RepID=UPI001C4D6AAC|nr:oxysterol-binding protein-related protein 1D-like isoform X3 [Zingiber officinale]
MNPLCCIAPVSLDRGDRDPSPMVGLKSSKPSIGAESPTRNSSSKKLIQVPVILSDSDAAACVETEAEEAEGLESGDGRGGSGNGAVAGVIWKWVNYGKGWRSRWFVLQDGVLSYYKVHGPDRISVGSAGRESGVRVIGEESLRRMRKEQQLGMGSGGYAGPRWKPFGEVHLKVSSVRASKSDDKRLYIFTGTKTLHLRCDSREDRTAWLDALLSAKDHFARSLAINEPEPSVEVTVSTDKLRVKLMQEGLSEAAVKECETIMLSEVSELQDQLKSLQQRHLILLDTLRQLETEKVELETTIIDERKEREAQLGMVNGRFSDFYSIISEGTATDSEVDNESQGADVDTDEDDGTYFDTRDFLSAELLRNTSYRSREAMGNGCVVSACSIESTFPANCQDMVLGVRRIEYPYVERRNKLPEPKEKEKPVGLWSIIKENIGKDLSGVCLPVYFNEPLSSLQKCFEDLEYSYLVDRALEWGRQGNSLMRILHIAAFAVSGYASTEGRQCKPFNPLLGETYEADYPDKGLRFISEKVSHHPMVVACHCDGRGWTFCGDSNLKGKFWGRSIQLDPIGILTLQFEDGETFQWSKVTTSIYNIIIGKIYCDHYGTMRIRGSGQYSCKLKFKEQSIIDRNPHQVHGFVQDNRTGDKVAMLMGKWDEAMYYVLGDPTTKPKGYDPMSEAVLIWERDKFVNQTRYNLTPFAISLNELTPSLMEKLPPTDSRLRPDQRHLENGEYELANIEKLRLEQLQRQARKLQEKGWQPRWFRRNREDDCYQYVGGYWEARKQRKWDEIPDVFGKGDDFHM